MDFSPRSASRKIPTIFFSVNRLLDIEPSPLCKADSNLSIGNLLEDQVSSMPFRGTYQDAHL